MEDLQWGLQQFKEGRIKPLIDQTLPLSRASEAHKLIAKNKVQGNIVLLPWA
ncbi:MAG: zinc-binding dehydrogenase [Candidatus Poribacteria bacterium]|nr:zinc-binding dehydrogenase [Candidatus Poribacteria bacterium]